MNVYKGCRIAAAPVNVFYVLRSLLKLCRTLPACRKSSVDYDIRYNLSGRNVYCLSLLTWKERSLVVNPVLHVKQAMVLTGC